MIRLGSAAFVSTAFCLAQAAPAWAATPEDAVASAVEQLVPIVVDVRGRAFVKPVISGTADETQLRKTLVRDEPSPARLNAMREALVAFHLATPDQDLAALRMQALIDQVAGYYDTSAKALSFVVRPDALIDGSLTLNRDDRHILTHELVHALQDQHFPVAELENTEFTSSDVQLGVLALIEGDASYASLFFEVPADQRDILRSATPAAMSEWAPEPAEYEPYYGSLGALPRFTREQLLFPYVFGRRFAVDLTRRAGWEDLDKAYAQPPLSSEQILHPGKYTGQKDPPRWPQIPDLAQNFPNDWSVVADDAWGELGIRTMFSQHLPQTPRLDRVAAAEGWGGDRFQVWGGPDGDRCVVWATTWDTTRDAEAFAEIATNWVEAVYTDLPAKKRSKFETSWSGDHLWSVRVERFDVVLLLGVPKSSAKQTARLMRHLHAPPIRSIDDAQRLMRPHPSLTGVR